jgi:hypothetical protein
MNVDIQTERIAIRPEWRRVIDAWVRGCRKHHPDVLGIELRLGHADRGPAGEKAEVLATARQGRRRAAGHAALMSLALQEALDALEYELLVHDAVARPACGAAGA